MSVAVSGADFDIVKEVSKSSLMASVRHFGMASVRHFATRRPTSWCALVILTAVCSLTVNVATRYSSPTDFSTHAVKTAVKHSSSDQQRQRLANDAANWVTPIYCTSALLAPASYARFAPERPSLGYPGFADALYNRPPPSLRPLT